MIRLLQHCVSTSCIIIILFSSAGYCATGMVLKTTQPQYNTGDLVLRYLSTSIETTLVAGGVWGPSFSPEGNRIAYSSNAQTIYICNLNGSGRQAITTCGGKEVYITWTADNYLYWGQCDLNIYKVKIDGTDRQTVYTHVDNIHNLGVSQDGLHASWTSPPGTTYPDAWYCYGRDLSTSTGIFFGYGCMNVPSPDGTLITRNVYGHTRCEIVNWSTLAVTKTIYPPQGTFNLHRWSHSSQNHILYTIENLNQGYLLNIQTDELTATSSGIAWDYFPTELPLIPFKPSINLSDDTIRFSAAQGSNPIPDSITVTITNTTEGTTLDTVYVEGNPAWLITALAGSGNSRTIINKIDTSQITGTGTFEATITVTGSNTTSKDSYRVILTVFTLRDPENPQTCSEQGLNYKYYEGSWDSMPDFTTLAPAETGSVQDFALTPANRTTSFGFVFTDYITIPANGSYTFYTSSDDGSKLFIGDILVVDNDSVHTARESSGTIPLKAGKHAISVQYFQQTTACSLLVSYAGPGISKAEIPASALCHLPLPRVPIIISAPVSGQSFLVDDSLIVSYDADCNVVPGVKMELSVDSGKIYSIVEASGSLLCGVKTWKWLIPDSITTPNSTKVSSVSDYCIIRVAAYMGLEFAESPVFEILPGGIVHSQKSGSLADPDLRFVRGNSGGLSVAIVKPGSYILRLLSPDGSVIIQRSCKTAGLYQLTGKNLMPGAYLLQINKGAGSSRVIPILIGD